MSRRTCLETLTEAIASSPIVVPAAPNRPCLPAGFEDIDIAILDWIVTQARRAGRKAIRM